MKFRDIVEQYKGQGAKICFNPSRPARDLDSYFEKYDQEPRLDNEVHVEERGTHTLEIYWRDLANWEDMMPDAILILSGSSDE